MSRSGRVKSVLMLATCGFLLAGCASPQESPGPRPSSPPPTAQETTPAATFFEGGTATQNLPYFLERLQEFSSGTEPVQGVPLVNALAAAGFDKALMQVSFDESKTGLTADSIFVSVRAEGDCIIGQVVGEDRTVAAEVVPAVGPEKNICLIGNTRPIDW